MNVLWLNRFRWISFSLSTILLISTGLAIDFSKSDFLGISLFCLWLISCVALIILFIYKRSTINKAIRRTLLYLIPVSIAGNLIIAHLFDDSVVADYLAAGFLFTFLSATTVSIINYSDKIEWILSAFIPVLIIGFILNRIGMAEGQYIIPFAFFVLSIGFFYYAFKTLLGNNSNRKAGRILSSFYIINGLLNALLFLKFCESQPAFFSFYDISGAILFIMACIALFIIMPLSDFVDWSIQMKKSFKRLVIMPLIIFLVIFSLKFLLPDNTYRRIFFKEYSEKKKDYFLMKEYEIDFTKRN